LKERFYPEESLNMPFFLTEPTTMGKEKWLRSMIDVEEMQVVDAGLFEA